MERKLIVEVVEAHNLLPKDGTGTSSAYVVIDFDCQKRKTQTVLRDLNPTWNEVLEFNVNGSLDMPGETLEVDVYHDKRVGPSRRNNFLGRVRLDSRHFVRKGEEVLMHFPLERKSFFNWVRGEIGLKVYYVEVPIPDPIPPAEPAEKGEETSKPTEAAPATSDAEKPQWTPTTETEPTPEQPKDAANPETEEKTPPSTNKEKPTEQPLEKSAETEIPQTEATPPATEPNSETAPPPLEVEKQSSNPNPRQLRTLERTLEPVERTKYDLVDKMQYLFVRVVRARSLPGKPNPRVLITAYGRNMSTGPARRSAFYEWNQTFTFSRDASSSDSSALEVSVWDLLPNTNITDVANADNNDKQFLGGVCFDISDVPLRDPPDSPLALQWYRLEGSVGSGHLMLATWIGTQADEAFADAIKAEVPSGQVASQSKVYMSPKLWYLRATIIEAQDAVLSAPSQYAVSVRATLGFQVQKTRPSSGRNVGVSSWNEDLLFVAAEPFGDDQRLVLTLEARFGKDTIVLGSANVPLSSVERRVDDRKVSSRWLDLVPPSNDGANKKGWRSGGRLHLRVCFDGGYHVSDEMALMASDFRPSARQLWKAPLGTIELGIIGCKGLLPMRAVEGKGTTDAYAVAKYGPKWARTRTVADSFEPAWNEQYNWPVYDPCTVLTVAVFDDTDGSKESTSRPMGKVRIRLSTLEANRVYRGLYPLVLLLPSGVKRMGAIELAVRFSRVTSPLDLLQLYSQPMLPLMHLLRPIHTANSELLRLAAARIVAAHLLQSEPPLRREVTLWMLEATEPRGFSMRKVRANWYRIVAAMSWLADVAKWVGDLRAWRNSTATLLAHCVLVLLVWYPELVGPTLAVHMAVVGAWRYRKRVRGPTPHPCVRTSQAELVEREELDEEFDPIPSTKGAEVMRVRYDRMRGVATRFQTTLGDVAVQAERVQALVTWRDPLATCAFVIMCILVAAVLYIVPTRMVAVVSGFYFLRHPMFRNRRSWPVLNFFRRLPSLADRVL